METSIGSTLARVVRVLVTPTLLLLTPSGALRAGTVISGMDLHVAGDNTVTINSQGSSAYPGSVGSGGNYPYTNGWGHVSGSIEWRDTNNTLTLRLDSSGADVLNSGGIANSNGSKSGSITLSGSTTLGANLRSTYGVGTHSFTSAVSQGTVSFNATGTVTIDVFIPPSKVLVSGLDLTVDGSDEVTVNNTGSSQYFGSVGAAGTYGYINGWSWVSGEIIWRDTNNNIAARLNSSGVVVPVSNRIANSNGSKSGSVQLDGNKTLGTKLRSAFGTGTSSFQSTIASSGSLDYAVTGSVDIAPLAPDLEAVSPGIDDATPSSGQTVMISATVKNVGAGATPEKTTLRYLRSINSFICFTCGVDEVLDTDSIPILAGGSSSAESDLVAMPVSTEQDFEYWVGACVDAVTGESDTSTASQCSAGVPIVMNCDRLAVESRTVGSVTTFQACQELVAGPALNVTAITAPGVSLHAGERVTFENGLEVGPGGMLSVFVCGQDLCEAGPASTPLSASCHPCVETVCETDPYCCETDWDNACKNEVTTLCPDLNCP